MRPFDLYKIATEMIQMPKPDFIHEHEHLLKVLKNGTPAERMAEYREQKEELDKKAANDREDMLVAAPSAVVGAAAINAAVPHIHGRETLWHGTSRDAAKAIRENGLQASFTGGENTSTSILKNHPGMAEAYEKSKGMVFTSPDKGLARIFARQNQLVEQKGIHRHEAIQRAAQYHDAGEFFADHLGLNDHKYQDHMVEFSVPTWRKDIKDRMVLNPEFVRAGEIAKQQHHPIQHPQIDREVEGMSRGTFLGDLGPEYAKGSSKYKALHLGEIAEYAAHEPLRFTAGVGGAALGAAAIGYAGKRLYDVYQRHQQKEAATINQDVGRPNPIISEDLHYGIHVRAAEQHGQTPLTREQFSRAFNDPQYVQDVDRMALGRLAVGLPVALGVNFATYPYHRGNLLGTVGSGLVGAGIGQMVVPQSLMGEAFDRAVERTR